VTPLLEIHTTQTERETAELGGALARRLRPGDTVALYGELGTGKTRFVQGVCTGLGVGEHVASPTFTIVNEYRTPAFKIYHFDLYRVNSAAELREVGFEEYTSGDGICLIEWAEKAVPLLPAHRYDVSLKFGVQHSLREITIAEIIEVAA
jgi:tRNA threonylcarbamoyladenosine biosynthesis protein TsaE